MNNWLVASITGLGDVAFKCNEEQDKLGAYFVVEKLTKIVGGGGKWSVMPLPMSFDRIIEPQITLRREAVNFFAVPSPELVKRLESCYQIVKPVSEADARKLKIV